MKRFNVILVAAAMLLTADIAHGQTSIDALRFSLVKPGGTARSLALGGAIGAVGADQGGLAINPAGIGFYRKSEITISGDLLFSNATTNMSGNRTDDGKTNFTIPNAGVVFTKLLNGRFNARSKWESVNFGLTLNRLADFNSQRSYNNPGSTNSILTDYKNDLNSMGVTPGSVDANANSFAFLGTAPAWDSRLLNPNPLNDSTTTNYTAVTDNAKVGQQAFVRTSGAINELALTLGANYDNTLYIGGSVGIPFLNYNEDITVTESSVGGNIPHFNSLTQDAHLNTSGVGVNFKFGMIYKPNAWFRVGASVHTPTYYHLTDNYNINLASSFDSANYSNGTSSSFDYHLNTPFRAIGSAAVFFKNYGFFSADYEYANYSKARYGFPVGFGTDQLNVNQQIATNLKVTHTIRVGLELAYKIFRLRGGYAYTTSPIPSSAQVNGADYSSMTYSAGIGFRWKRFFLDMTYYRYHIMTSSVFASNVTANNDLKQDNAVMTLGFNFGRAARQQQ